MTWRITGLLALIALIAGLAVAGRAMVLKQAAVECALAVSQLKQQAAGVLASETAKTTAAEKALNDFKTKREAQDADNKRTVAGLERRLATLAGPTGRLRDPNAAPARCGGGGNSAEGADPSGTGDRADNAADAAGLLSADFSRLLIEQTQIADAINLAYISCRPDALNVREALR